MVCKGAGVRGLFILSKLKWHILIAYLFKKLFSKPCPGKYNLGIKTVEE